MPYIAQIDLEQYSNETLTGNGIAQFNLLLPLMQAMVDQYLNRTFTFTNPVTEYFDAFSKSTPPAIQDTFFPQYPISKTPFNVAFPRAGGINSITFGEVNGAGGTLLDLTYAYNYGTSVKIWSWSTMISMFNPFGLQAVKIIYNSDDAGNVPPPVKLALIVWMARMIDTSPDSSKEAVLVQTDTVQARFAQDKIGGMPDFVCAALNPYRYIAIDRF